MSLYCEAVVQGSAEMVRPSWDSREAAFRDSCCCCGEAGVVAAAVMIEMMQTDKSARTWFRIGL